MANPPPPYSDITGISRAVMKDNAQETLVNYNGNARPGELVVDLTQDPPPLYVGNNQGQLTLVTSGGAGIPTKIENGDSKVEIATAAGDVEVWVNDTNTVNITNNAIEFVDPYLDISDQQGARIWNDDGDLNIVNTGDDIIFTADDDVFIETGGGAASWQFTNTGNLNAPGNIETTGYIGAGSIAVSTSVTGQTLVTDPGPLSGLTPVFGARGFINDGNLTAAGNFGAQVSGGGGNSVPVWSDGVNWYIG